MTMLSSKYFTFEKHFILLGACNEVRRPKQMNWFYSLNI